MRTKEEAAMFWTSRWMGDNRLNREEKAKWQEPVRRKAKIRLNGATEAQRVSSLQRAGGQD